MSGRSICIFVLGVVLFLSFTVNPVAQQSTELGTSVTVPRLVTINGILKDRSGRPLGGVVGIAFALYKDQQGGMPLWTEIQNVQVDEQGRFGTLLGATQGAGLPMELFTSSEPRWLGVSAQISGEEEQSRILLVSVPYALKAADADTIGGKPASAFVLNNNVADAKVSGSALVSALAKDGSSANTFAVGGTGTVNKLPKWVDTLGTLADSAVFESGGNVGIGTTNPISKLNVATSGPDYITLSAYNVNLYDKGFLVRSARNGPPFPESVQIGDILFNLYAQGHDGTDYGIAGGISMAVDGAVSTGRVPGSILFSTANSTGTYAERMRVNAAGNVGIGTNNPTARLEVNGQVKATSFVGDGSQLTNVSGGGGSTATNVTCSLPCVSSAEIENQTIVDGNISPTAAIAPSKIAGTAATLGTNTFTGTQTISPGNLALNGTASASSGVVTLGGNRFLHGYGTNNTFLGTNAGNFAVTGVNNTATGAYSLNSTTQGYNTANGAYSLYSNTIGYQNTASGVMALFSNTSGTYNTATGVFALYSNGGNSNTATGANSLYSNIANNNTAYGASSLLNNTTGTENTAIGGAVMAANDTGSDNTATGFQALGLNKSSQNTATGVKSLYSNTTGTNNTAVGYFAGDTADAQHANSTGSNNTFIGYQAGPGTSTQLNNATAIGANALVSASNAVVLGDSTVNVGIRTTAPTRELEVNGGVRLNTATVKPTCNATARGTFWVTQQGAGVEDSVEVCIKNAADAYVWKTVF